MQPLVPGATDALIVRRLAALILDRRESQQSPHLATILERAPHQAFIEQHGRARRRDTFELDQARQRALRRRLLQRRGLARLDRYNLVGDHRQPRLGARDSRLHRRRQQGARPIPDAAPPGGLLPHARGHAAPARREPAADLIAQPRLFLHERRAFATPMPRRFRLRRGHAHLGEHPRLAAARPDQHHHQLPRIDPIAFRPSRATIDLDTR